MQSTPIASNGEKQGYLGELASKSTPELKELLKRQEKLLTNIKFVQRLPDKGDKIRKMIDKVRVIMDQRTDVDNTAEMFEQMAIDADDSQRKRLQGKGDMRVEDIEDEDEEEEGDQLKHVINRQMEEKSVKDEREEEFVNSYDRVIRKAEERQHKGKFMPYRTVKSKDVEALQKKVDLVSLETPQRDIIRDFDPTEGHQPTDKEKSKPETQAADTNILKQQVKAGSSIDIDATAADTFSRILKNKGQRTDNKRNKEHKTNESNVRKPHLRMIDQGKPEGTKLQHRYDDSLMPVPSTSKCIEAQVIDIYESARIQIEQKQTQDQLQATQAASRLAERLHIKMSHFEPEGSSKLAYRDTEEEQGMEDADSDDGELEYPD